MFIYVYAIEHETDGFLPQTNKKNNSYQKPCHDKLPRLFPKKISAERALRNWAKGEWHAVYTPGDFEGGPEYSHHEPKKGTERDITKMHVIKMKLERA